MARIFPRGMYENDDDYNQQRNLSGRLFVDATRAPVGGPGPRRPASFYWPYVEELARTAGVTLTAAQKAAFERAYDSPTAEMRGSPLTHALRILDTALATAATPEVGGGVVGLKAPEPERSGTCSRVWTSAYAEPDAAESRHVIIRHTRGTETHHIVLSLNPGHEQREIDAFIQAYARGGQVIGSNGQVIPRGGPPGNLLTNLGASLFTTHTAALDRAFELERASALPECTTPMTKLAPH